MKRTLALMLCLLAMPALAASAEKKDAQAEAAKRTAVQGWLDMQRSGSQASSVPQTLTPVIQERVVKRYLDSFNAPIPVFFVDETSTSTSAAVAR